MKFIHAADIHLDSPLRGLERYEGAPVDEARGATRKALENLVDLALAERVAFVLVAGDLFDDDWRDYNTGLFFVRQMQRLAEARIPVLIASGNHDAASQITKSLRVPGGVAWFDSSEPETRVLEEHGVAIHGQSYPKRAVTADLAKGYPSPVPGLLNLGVLHTGIDGRVGHEPYAPCTVPGLAAKGYDYWALGHVHAREICSREPWIVYSGNLQGRHARETGPKGCSLVTIEGAAVASVEHRSLDAMRWLAPELAVPDDADLPALLDLFEASLGSHVEAAEGRLLALRLKIRGGRRARERFAADPARWRGELRGCASRRLEDRVWLEKVEFLPDERPAPALAHDDAALASLRSLPCDAELLARFAKEMEEIERKLPAELKGGPEPVDLRSEDAVRRLLEEVKPMLLARLTEGGGR